MLYVDNPIGTGFSYTNDNKFFTTDAEIANGLVSFVTQFFDQHTEYQTRPFWIFTESYGGKMTAIFGASLFTAIQNGKVKANFQGVALGDGWLAPVDCMKSYGPYLLAFSLIDEEQYTQVEQYATEAEAAIAANDGNKATDLWGQQQQYISNACDGCNWYNSINSTDLDAAESQLNKNCQPGGSFYQKVQSAIPSNVNYGSQSGQVFSHLSDAFMRSGVWAVEFLLKSGVHVNVYSGQLDIIVDALCTETWINNMTWTGLSTWKQQPEVGISIDGVPQGFVRSYKNFAFYRIMRAGHMVPHDNAPMAFKMVQDVINGPNKR